MQITEGSGKKIALSPAYTEGASTAIYDQSVILGDPYNPTYSVTSATAIGLTVANKHVLEIMAAAGTVPVKIRRFVFTTNAAAGSAGSIIFGLYRLISAGTGGSVITPQPFDTGDTAGATAMVLPTALGTEGAQVLMASPIAFSAAAPTGGSWSWEQTAAGKPLVIPAGANNGLCWKNLGSNATATVNFIVEFTEI